MLPRTRAPLMRPARHSRVPLPVLLATVMAIPFLLWFVMFMAPAKPPPAPPPRLMDKLRNQGLAGGGKEQAAAGASALGDQAAPAATAAGSPSVFTWAPPDQIAAAGRYLQGVVLQPRKRAAVAAATYVIDPEPHDMRVQHKQVSAYLASPVFKSKLAARQAGGTRGIIINAGGPHLITSTIVTLKVLREVLNCSLPVELVWHQQHEMDNATLAELQVRWGPVTGIDLSSLPWPAHHRPRPEPGQPGWNESNKFIGKVMSLTTSSFASALLLDADSLPLTSPQGLWDDAAYKSQGNLFWPDFWTPSSAEHQEVVYDMVGLKHTEAQELLAAGKGRLLRDTESGQLLLDLVKHADVAEWALWINSFGDSIYKAVWGDKDTFGLAFAVAGKAHEFHQLQVPPGAALTWRPDKLLIKSSGAKQAGWQLAGMVQHTAAGQAAFLHRTMNKFSWGGEAWQLGLITGPLPLRWIHYYLSQDALGPTVGVPYDYVAPATAFVPWYIPHPVNKSVAQQDSWAARLEEVCPAATFITYWRLREHGIPIGTSPSLETACAPLLKLLLGAAAEPYAASGLSNHPELLALGSNNFDKVILKRHNPNPLVPAEEVPDSSPVVAWVPDYVAPAAVATPVSRALSGSYEAFEWIKGHMDEFPIIKGSREAAAGPVQR